MAQGLFCPVASDLPWSSRLRRLILFTLLLTCSCFVPPGELGGGGNGHSGGGSGSGVAPAAAVAAAPAPAVGRAAGCPATWPT